MIKANELRIGNFVFAFRPKSEVPEPILIDKHFYLGYDEATALAGLLTIVPISINESILLEFGFKEYPITGSDFSHLINFGDYTLAVSISKSFASLDYKIDLHDIKYVHQLQNLYFALTGKELKIESGTETSGTAKN